MSFPSHFLDPKTTDHASLKSRDFVNIFEEDSAVFLHVAQVLPNHYQTYEGKVAGLVINEFKIAHERGKRVRHVIGAYNERADRFLLRHREVQLGL